ncbi:MAG: hypothetical protein QG669_138 [Patescibacteria group bacterium]|nr:hypothetical protein [Patescibacteria group bacterium]MDQ5961746.1 hypothetical protein [Patescibacteria group bacterium]
MIIEKYSDESIFKTQFSTLGNVLVGILVVAMVALMEKIIYDVIRKTVTQTPNYLGDINVITTSAMIIVPFLLVALMLGSMAIEKKKNSIVILFPVFATAIILTVQLLLQVSVYFANNHTNAQFYMVMVSLVVVSTYGIYFSKSRQS